ncbi:MAG: hypothetical protein V7K32_07150 [Nostoc sp.]
MVGQLTARLGWLLISLEDLQGLGGLLPVALSPVRYWANDFTTMPVG